MRYTTYSTLYYLMVLVLLGCSACVSSDFVVPPAPVVEPAPVEADDKNIYTGRWQGEMMFEDYRASVEVTLTQDLVFIRGRGSLTIDLPLYKSSQPGSIRGIIKDDTVQFSLTPDNPKYCYYEAEATLESRQLTGTFKGANCRDESIGGAFYLNKID